jgi:hypothetical protein
LSLLSISCFYLGGNNLVTSVASRDMLPRDAARADLPKVSTVYPDRSSAIVVGGGVTVGPIAAAYFALPVALAAEMLAPTAVEEVAGAAVGETMATVMALLDLQIIW